MLFVYGLGAWLLFMVTAIANGAFRESLLLPRFGSEVGHWISTAMLCVLLVIEIVVFLAIVGDGESSGDLLALGAMWLVLTLLFEFGFGHWVAKKPWRKLLADYNVLEGRAWPAVLLVILFTPVVTGS
jgi:hypothetical protein